MTAAAAPAQTDEDVLASMGLSAAISAELLASPEALIDKYGGDITVEHFLKMQCEKHVSTHDDTATALVFSVRTLPTAVLSLTCSLLLLVLANVLGVCFAILLRAARGHLEA